MAAAVAGLALIAALSLAGRAAAAGPCDPASASIDAAEARLLDLINDARAEAGAPPLLFSPALNRAAAWMSEHLASTGAFSHTDGYGRSPSERARDCGYPWGAGENLARGSSSPDVVLAMWMESPGHRQNMLASYYRVIGIGYAGGVWTLDFGTFLDGGTGEPSPTPTPTPSPTPTMPVPSSTTAPPTATATPTAAAPPSGSSGGQLGITLAPGFNLVTYVGAPLPVWEALGSARQTVTAVYAWDPFRSRWLRYVTDAPAWVSTLFDLQPGEAYFVGSESFTVWFIPTSD